MAIAVPATKESLAATYAGLASYASLHTADPGTTGASEVTGGSPAYARVAITWSAGSSDGIYTATLASPFNVPASTNITHLGLWDAATAGNYRDKATLVASFAAQGTLTVSTFTFAVA